MFGITHWIVLPLTSQGNEAQTRTWGKISNSARIQWERTLRLEVWAAFQELAGVHCMEVYVLPIWYFTHLTECTFMFPYFIVSVGVILNPLTCISHLNLHMQACLSLNWGEAGWDKSRQTFLPRWFPYISDFIVSQDSPSWCGLGVMREVFGFGLRGGEGMRASAGQVVALITSALILNTTSVHYR